MADQTESDGNASAQELASLRARVDLLTEENEALRRTVDAEFGRRDRLREDLNGDFLGAAAGFLRVSRSGGMSAELSSQVLAAIETMIEHDHVAFVLEAIIDTEAKAAVAVLQQQTPAPSKT
jgi:hypothetical protein